MTGVDDGEKLALLLVGTGRIWDIYGGSALLKGRKGGWDLIQHFAMIELKKVEESKACCLTVLWPGCYRRQNAYAESHAGILLLLIST